MVWQHADETRDIPWAEIRLIEEGAQGATLHLADDHVLIPRSTVWYEFVVEDLIEKARKANPEYEGPAPTPKPRPLEIPKAHDDQMVYVRRAQRFYKDRCPSYREFQEFLKANQGWVFDEGSYYECSMCLCSGSPVGEGYSTDLKIPKSKRWYFDFEKRTGGNGSYTGAQLLSILSAIPPVGD